MSWDTGLKSLSLKEAKKEGYLLTPTDDSRRVRITKRVFNPKTRKNRRISLGEFRIELFASTYNIGKKKEDKDLSKNVWFVFVEIPGRLVNSLRNIRIEFGEITLFDLKKLGVKTPYEIDLISWLKL